MLSLDKWEENQSAVMCMYMRIGCMHNNVLTHGYTQSHICAGVLMYTAHPMHTTDYLSVYRDHSAHFLW